MDINLKIEFIRKRLKRPIVLVGLMGAGKTSLGKAMAKELRMEFVDSDNVITTREGLSVAEIFEKSGEAYFRDLERQIILELTQDKDIRVIGTGGGAFMNDETRQAIQVNALSIFLRADLNVLARRVGAGRGRPLFDGKDPREVLADLMTQRYPVYEEAHLTVATHEEPKEETLNRVFQTLYSVMLAG